ncbi:MAG: hypothetical protein QGG53_17640 [Planctomycetota bacterium]|jgi:hypothetical protein|nr:hypothetical protein [Planctomycetota bacterium]
MIDAEWVREAWGASVSAKGYNADWWATLTPENEPGLWKELRSILEDENAIALIPEWAADIVVRMMELPMCGYYAYPENVTQIIDAIAAQRCPDVVKTCYTADPERKVLLSYYVFCLDAWSKGAPLLSVVAEVLKRDQLGKDWEEISGAVYRKLGERSDIKTAAVIRLIHRLRWWIKTLIWSDDKRDRFLLDVYSGDIRGDEEKWGAYGNSPYGDPYFVELEQPYVKVMVVQILADLPGGKRLLERIHSTWLCAPKVFRYLERLIAEIGSIGSDAPLGEVQSILDCEDTYPDFDADYEHFIELLENLQLWLDGDGEALPHLGEMSPVKRWLAHLLRHKLVFHARYEENFAKLVGKRPHGKSGSRKPNG